MKSATSYLTRAFKYLQSTSKHLFSNRVLKYSTSQIPLIYMNQIVHRTLGHESYIEYTVLGLYHLYVRCVVKHAFCFQMISLFYVWMSADSYFMKLS